MVRTTTRRALARGWSRSDEGASMVVVVTAFALLFTLVLTTSLYVTRSLRQTVGHTDAELALSAAESGITDYFTRASAVPGYWEATDCDNVALEVPGSTGCADIPTEYGWAPVEAGDDPADSPAYHYEVLRWDEQNGSEATWLTLRVTGRSGDQHRTLEVQATRPSTEKYAAYQNHWARPMHAAACTDTFGARAYQRSPGAYEGTAMPTVRCLRTLTTYWQTGWFGADGTELAPAGTSWTSDWSLNAWVNEVQGDFFSNDIGFLNPGPVSMSATYRVDGALILANPACREATQSAWATGWRSGAISTSCGVLPRTASGAFNPPVSRVTTTAEPELSATKTLPYGTAALEEAPGCRYYGPTRVVLEGDGTMRVWSKQSVHPGLTLTRPSAEGVDPDCGSPAALASDAGAHVAVPDGMVVYVADLPDQVAAAHGVINGRLDAHEIGGDARYGLLPVGDVLADVLATLEPGDRGTVLFDTSTYSASRYRTKGNLWVEGALHGAVTFGSVGAVLITGDLVAEDPGPGGDQLGIVASDVTVVDQRLVLTGMAELYPGGASWSGLGNGSSVYQHVGGADPASGALGAWPHDYDRDAAQVRIDAAVQVLNGGLGYQDAPICILERETAQGWSRSDRYYYDFPFVTVTDQPDGHQRVTIPELTQGEATLEVQVTGSLAQNYLSATGSRFEAPGSVTTFQSSDNRGHAIVYYPAGSCGMDVSVDYDERLDTSAPPYLLRFTDVPWARADASEVDTPERLRA